METWYMILCVKMLLITWLRMTMRLKM